MKALMVRAEYDPKQGYVKSPFEERTGCPENGNLVWRYPKFAIEEVPHPSPKPDEVILKIGACGICGSDVHASQTDVEHYIKFSGKCKFPQIIGHEVSGEVAEAGSKVKTLREGDIVTVEEMNWCGECPPCKEGMPNQCLYLNELGFTIPGGYEEYVAVKEKYCWKINSIEESVGSRQKALEAGALVEPTSVAYNGVFVRGGGIRPGDYVVIYGAGPIGLACTALTSAAGASKVLLFEVSEARRRLAREMGAESVFDPTELERNGTTVARKIRELTGGEGADLQVEAAGAADKTFPEIERSMGVGCKVVQIGFDPAETSPIKLTSYMFQGAKLCGSIGHSGHSIFPHVIRLMASGKIDMTKIVTSRMPLTRAIEALEQAGKPTEGKILVKP